AEDTILDVDFSSASSEFEDAAFENSLKNAGGYALLAAFQQRVTADGSIAFNLPLERFRAFSKSVAVNVTLDAAGAVRVAPFGVTLDGVAVPSAAADLAEVYGPADSGFAIDYSIDPRTVDRVSVADLL